MNGRQELGQVLYLDFRKRVIESEDVLVREIDGQAILLNLETEAYFGLNEPGTRMWELLTSSPSIDDAYRKLLDEFEVEPERLKADLGELLAGLIGQGLVAVEG